MKTIKIRYFFNSEVGIHPVLEINNSGVSPEFSLTGFRELEEEEVTFCLVHKAKVIHVVDTLAEALQLCNLNPELEIMLPFYPKSVSSQMASFNYEVSR